MMLFPKMSDTTEMVSRMKWVNLDLLVTDFVEIFIFSIYATMILMDEMTKQSGKIITERVCIYLTVGVSCLD